ncbi:hypothetical protein MSAN_02186900 [Mycena sanguinolenta]|uniref:Uncharacterized protein n=1 Tax=Mycena sanguinolenta TaxID=230812 RepID=A0A8H7CJ86_9AGAR|nr:hypothetical protein MSAN_02186900 [Mycena sanguinolenta]
MHPPFYILTVSPPAPALVHPTIQYHYKDDPPLALLPQPAEQVLVLDYDPETADPPTVQSISPSISVTGLRVEEAPGAAAAAADEGVVRNDRMYIIENTTTDSKPLDASMGERKPPHMVLAQFKQRNALLRRSLLYPNTEVPDLGNNKKA